MVVIWTCTVVRIYAQQAKMCLSICLFSLLSLLLLPTLIVGQSELSIFYITGLFPTGSSDPQVKNALGIYPRAAAQYAVQRVNQLGLLSEYNVTLKLETFNSGCQGIASGTHGLIQAVLFARRFGVYDTSTGEIINFSGELYACSCMHACTVKKERVVMINFGHLSCI